MKLDMKPSPKAEKSGLKMVQKDAKVGGQGGYSAGKPSMGKAVKALHKQHKA